MTDRYSTPPSASKLTASTDRLAASNDALERKVGHLPAPAPQPVVAVTDEQRLQVCRELVAYQFRHGQTHMDQALYAYEAEAKGRLGR